MNCHGAKAVAFCIFMEEMMEPTKLLNAKQAGAYLNCTVSKIRKDLHEGRLEFVKIGRLVRIRKDHLDELIEANTHKRFCGEKGDEAA